MRLGCQWILGVWPLQYLPQSTSGVQIQPSQLPWLHQDKVTILQFCRRPIYRGSQTKILHFPPIFLVWKSCAKTELFHSLFSEYILCLPKTHLHRSHWPQAGVTSGWITALMFSHIQLLRIRLIPHCCCQRGSYLTEERKRGSCSRLVMDSLAPHPTPGKAHSSFPYLSAIRSPCHLVQPPDWNESETVSGAGCSEHQVPAGERFPEHSTCWLGLTGYQKMAQTWRGKVWIHQPCTNAIWSTGSVVKHVNLSKGSELKVPLPKVLWTFLEFWPTCRESQTSLWKTQQVSSFILRYKYSPNHQNPAYLDPILPSPFCSSNTNHLSPSCQTAQFATISGILIVLRLLLKEIHSKIPSPMLREGQYEWTQCLSFMVLAINSLTLKLFIYMTAGKSLISSPKPVTN